MYAIDPQTSYLRTKCGLPPQRAAVTPDPDDPASASLTTAEAARAAHVSEDTIRDWARRTLIVRTDDSTPEHPRYREIDVLRVEARTRRAARERRLLDEAARDVPASG